MITPLQQTFSHQCTLFAKSLGHIISSNICCHLNKYKSLAGQQHGFRSCETHDFATTLWAYNICNAALRSFLTSL